MARHVYPSDEIVHLWAHGADRDLRNASGNVFTIGDTIYSYGTHFPMAMRISTKEDLTVYLVSTRSYSVTTSSHQNMVRCAIPSDGTLIIPLDPHLWELVHDKASGKELREHFQERIDDFLKDANNNRMGYWRRGEAVQEAKKARGQFEMLRSVFRFRIRNGTTKFTVPDLTDAQKKQTERDTKRDERHRVRMERWTKQNEKANKERLARNAELKERAVAAFASWREGGNVPHDIRRFFPFHAIRVNGDKVETSLGVSIPLDDAREFLTSQLPRLRAAMGIYFSDITIGEYRGARATDTELIIGCHRIPWDEVQRFADSL